MVLASGFHIEAPGRPADLERLDQYLLRCCQRPDALLRGFLALASLVDSQAITRSALSTSAAAKYRDTNGRQSSMRGGGRVEVTVTVAWW